MSPAPAPTWLRQVLARQRCSAARQRGGADIAANSGSDADRSGICRSSAGHGGTAAATGFAAADASGEKFAAAAVPFVSERIRATLEKEYAPAGDFKAFSLNFGGFNAFVTGQPSEEAARSMAVEQCQKRADSASSPRKCELYAVGNKVVYTHGKPPMPPPPWIKHDPVPSGHLPPNEVPLTRDPGKARLENIYVPARKTKVLALGPGVGQYLHDPWCGFGRGGVAPESGIVRRHCRRPLHDRGAERYLRRSGSDNMKVTGFFKAADTSLIAPEARDDAARKLADARVDGTRSP